MCLDNAEFWIGRIVGSTPYFILIEVKYVNFGVVAEGTKNCPDVEVFLIRVLVSITK